MPPPKFSSVEEFREYLPDHEREIVDILRAIVRDCLPEAREKLSYNVPYYFLNTRVCYIWPASVPWGKVKLNGVTLGFCKGQQIPDELGLLDKGSRKEIATLTFGAKNEIDRDLLSAYLYEAMELDRQKS